MLLNLFLLPLLLCQGLIPSATPTLHIDDKESISVAINETNLQPSPYQLSRRATIVFYDDFPGNSLDHTKWYHEVTASGGGNGEFEVYTPESTNTFIKNGVLHLKPTFTADRFGDNFLHHGTLDVKEQWGVCTAAFNNGCHKQGSQHNIPPIMSSKLFSKVSIKHGRIEVLAKLPKGDWIWPAIWIHPTAVANKFKYGSSPRSGEIDIMESRGNLNLKDNNGNNHGVSRVSSTIHYGLSHTQRKQHGHWKLAPNGKTWADGYHTYSVDWTIDHIRTEVDGQVIFAWNTPPEGYWKHGRFSGNNIWAQGHKDAPFDGPFNLILNVAVGATDSYFNERWYNGAYSKPWRDSSSTAMMDFWKNRHQWQHTWHGDDVAMKIKSVKMIQY